MSAVVTRALRGTGWLCIGAGLLVLLYLVYSLMFTNVTTSQAQGSLAREWDLAVDDDVVGAVASRQGAAAAKPAARPARVDPDGAVAVLQFSRPGSPEPLVHADPLYVVPDVTLGQLARGPGHYPGTAEPGERGNFAVAGHRTTYGAPFFNLDDLRRGDEVHVTARDGTRYTYRVRKSQVVAPTAAWVLGPDPLGTGESMLTLTTCNPRFSNRERLIVFAELVA